MVLLGEGMCPRGYQEFSEMLNHIVGVNMLHPCGQALALILT